MVDKSAELEWSGWGGACFEEMTLEKLCMVPVGGIEGLGLMIPVRKGAGLVVGLAGE